VGECRRVEIALRVVMLMLEGVTLMIHRDGDELARILLAVVREVGRDDAAPTRRNGGDNTRSLARNRHDHPPFRHRSVHASHLHVPRSGRVNRVILLRMDVAVRGDSSDPFALGMVVLAWRS
jgi:hypothetical protein